MDERLESMATEIKEQYGLNNYFLHDSHLYREKSALQETIYLFSMEWFPLKYKDSETGDENPEGTAVIEIDFHTKKLHRLIFVNGISYAKQTSAYPENDQERIIEWIESLTGLVWGQQFQLAEANEGTYRFRATVDNIAVHPEGFIEITFQNNKLTHFSIDGVFPTEDNIIWEPFSLLPENVAQLSMEQLKLVEFPVDHQKKWVPVYAIEEIFVTNDGRQTFPVNLQDSGGTRIEPDILLEWETPASYGFARKELHLQQEEVTVEMAERKETDPNTLPISKAQADSCIKEARLFLQAQYPDDSGKWILDAIQRDHGYFIVELKETSVKQERIIADKIKLFIAPETMKTVNYIDKKAFMDIFADYASAADVVISKKEAFEKLQEHLEISPIYVYNPDKKAYVLCGKLDCEYGVDASNGQLLPLSEF